MVMEDALYKTLFLENCFIRMVHIREGYCVCKFGRHFGKVRCETKLVCHVEGDGKNTLFW